MARLAVAATTDHRNHSPVHDCRRRFRHTRRDQTLPRRFLDPASESARATATLAENFNQGDMELVLLVGSASGAKGGPAQAVGTDIAQQLSQSPFVSGVAPPWGAQPTAGLFNADAKTAMILVALKATRRAHRSTPGRWRNGSRMTMTA